MRRRRKVNQSTQTQVGPKAITVYLRTDALLHFASQEAKCAPLPPSEAGVDRNLTKIYTETRHR
jgi:hypothetical protein